MVALAAGALGPASASNASSPASKGVVDLPLRFEVSNQNRSRVVCEADGQRYEVRGRLVAPRSVLKRRHRAVTLYMHNLGFAKWYWRFRSVPGHDYATAMAKRGHASVVYDVLGYGHSDRPPGTQTCYGSDADVASQIIEHLKAGDYMAEKGFSPKFERVALASQSIIGLAAEAAAYSFKTVDALVVTSWADSGFSQRFTQEGSLASNLACAAGGEPAFGDSGPPGYAFAPPSETAFKELNFAKTNRRVVEEATERRTRTPCGEPQSGTRAIAANQAFLSEVKVPVLLAYGTDDASFTDPRAAGEQQKNRFSGSDDVSTIYIEDSGGALALERTAPRFRRKVSRWLADRGF